MVILEQRKQTSVPYHITQSIQNSTVLWTIDPLVVHNIINGGWVIAYILLYWTSWLEKTIASFNMTEYYLYKTSNL